MLCHLIFMKIKNDRIFTVIMKSYFLKKITSGKQQKKCTKNAALDNDEH